MNLALVLFDGFYFKNRSPVKSGGCCWASETCDTGGLKSNRLLIRMAGFKVFDIYIYIYIYIYTVFPSP